MKQTLAGIVGAIALGALCSCAHTVPPQLAEAREAYKRSNGSTTASLTPTDLYDAKKALDQANASFDSAGDSLKTRDLAYIALRKVEIANAKARAEYDKRQIAEATKSGVQMRDEQLTQTKEQLQATTTELEKEREARTAAEARLESVIRDLGAIA